MPLDGIAMHLVAHELDEALTGGRVDRVLQPEKDEVHLLFRSHGNNHRLVLSASASHARIHLTQTRKTNPLQAPLFCMLLRKRLSGSMLTAVRQPGMERIIELDFAAQDELGVISTLTLRVEIMGRHSNIILTAPDGRIIDCIKHIDESMSRLREVLPGLPYAYPPAQPKADPLSLDSEGFFQLLCRGGHHPAAKGLAALLQGLSMPTARLIASEVLTDPDMPLDVLPVQDLEALSRHLAAYYGRVRSLVSEPQLLWPSSLDAPADFLCFPTPCYPAQDLRPMETLSQAMDQYYFQRDLAERMRQRTQQMQHVVQNDLARCERKLAKQRETLLDTEKMEEYRLCGELLTAFQQQVPRGASSVTLPNYYDEQGGTLTIALDPSKGANDNAQAYYRRYRKARIAADLVKTQLTENLAEIDYLQGQLHNLSACHSESDIQEIYDELTQLGYLKTQKRRDKKQLPRSEPYHYRSSDGYDIYVGRNNVQNDRLTFRLARPQDIWLHTLKIPGSHVIIQAQDGSVSDTALYEGALLAAWHSQARGSSRIPVDAAPRRLVKKPAGAKPGFVTYSGQTTLYVTPESHQLPEMVQS